MTFGQLKQELNDHLNKENDLKELLGNCLYENEEEKYLIESELADLIKAREIIENVKLKELRSKHDDLVNKKMEIEHKGLADLKAQDKLEIKQDEERIEMLSESSIKRILYAIKEAEDSISEKNNELKNLYEIAEVNQIKMNMLLTRVTTQFCFIY